MMGCRPVISVEIAYGSLAFFSSILHNLFLLYHVDMFVSIYKIDKVSFWVGEALFLIWNSLNDPLFGWLSDKNLLIKKKSNVATSGPNIVLMRLSKLQFYGPLYALAFYLFWIKWIWTGLQFAVCLCLYDAMLTMIDIHHSALLADIAISANDRTNFSSKCSIFSALGSASVFLSYLVWNKSSLSDFRLFCFGLALLSFSGFYIISRLLKMSYTEHSKSALSDESPFEDNSMKEYPELSPSSASVQVFGRQILSHSNFKWFALMNLVQVFHCHFNSNFFPLFLDALLGSAVSPAFASCLLGLSFVVPHINNIYFLSLCRKYSTYTVIHGLLWVKLLLSIFMYCIGVQHLWILCFFIASNRVFTEGTCKLLSLVITDLVDEDMVIHRRSQAVSALIFGTAALLSKPGQTLAPLFGTLLLTYLTGHDIFESGETKGSMKLDMTDFEQGQQQTYRFGVFTLLTTVPIFCAIIQLAAWYNFTLRGNRLAQIKAARQSSLQFVNV